VKQRRLFERGIPSSVLLPNFVLFVAFCRFFSASLIGVIELAPEEIVSSIPRLRFVRDKRHRQRTMRRECRRGMLKDGQGDPPMGICSLSPKHLMAEAFAHLGQAQLPF